jgi:hypothetical protein
VPMTAYWPTRRSSSTLTTTARSGGRGGSVPARRFTSTMDGPAAALKHQLRLLRQEFEVR